MPISVKCPSCSHKFSAKDEYAGKRAKCPQCEEPLTVPGGAAPTPASRPKASAIAKALDDEADETPKAKRRRDEEAEDEKPRAKKRRDEEDEDEKPRAKKRRDEDEDDRPRGTRRRRDDDEKPKKKSNALVIVLSIVGGVLLLCGGGCAGVWFFVIKPAGESFASTLNSIASAAKQEREFRDKFQQVKAGMSKKEVEDLLGANHTRALEHDVGRVTIGLSDWPQADDRWKPKAKAGHVLLWDKSGDGVLVAFSTDPNAGGTVVGTAGNFGFTASEPVKLPAAVKTGDANNPVATLSVDDLSRQHATYRERWVTLTGVYNRLDLSRTGSVVLTAPTGVTMTVHPPLGGLFPFKEVQPQPGESMTFTGKVGGSDKLMTLDDSVFVRRTGTAPPPVKPSNALSTADLVRDHAKLRGQTVTVRGKVKVISEDPSRGSANVDFDTGGAALGVRARIPDGKWRTGFFQLEDTLEFTGTIGGLAGNPGFQLVELINCDVLKRTDKAGRDVPLPPVTPPQPVKPTPVNSEILVLDFAQNADAANKKYADKTLTVTGTVDKVSPTGLSVTLKGLAADGNRKAYVIAVGMTPTGREDAKKLKEGDPVKLTGKFIQFRAASGTTPNTVALTGGVVEK